jgi:predicted ribosome quality control (RQC) complex YloA/Tae2 family protein
MLVIVKREASEDIGRMSAQAVQLQYEHAAQAVERMGEEVQERIRRLTTALQECDEDMKVLKETAELVREKGQLVYAQIDEIAGLSKNIRETCAAFRTQLNGEKSPAVLPILTLPRVSDIV